MEVIITHKNIDFDALSSQAAASLIYKNAVLVQSDTQEQNVRDFLSAYSHYFKMIKEADINFADVKKVILVDTRQKGRIGKFASLLKKNVKWVIYDHHPPSKDDIKTGETHIRDIGATVTLLAEKIFQRKIKIPPLLASLFLLGIYEDTGSFTFSSTRHEDMQCAAELLKRGANLNLIKNYIKKPLSLEQKNLLKKLFNSLEIKEINKVPVHFCSAKEDEYIADIALLAHRIRDLESANVLFILVQMENKVHIVGRSALPEINAGKILEKLGGGGHWSAASATLKSVVLKEAYSGIVSILKKEIKTVLTAKDIMSSPVKSVKETLSIKILKRVMLRISHSTLPVINSKGELTGIITMKDAENAISHNLSHAPVKGFMNINPLTAAPSESIYKIQKKMTVNNISSLPVVLKKRPIGIITTTDIMKNLYGLNIKTEEDKSHFKKIKINLKQKLPPTLYKELLKIKAASKKLKMKSYLVGGFVRDVLMGEKNWDVDIVVEGDAIKLVNFLFKDAEKVYTHKKFLTAKVKTKEGLTIDFATAREEYYETAASLPKVEKSSLKQDLYRRDFTINAMALSIGDDFGTVYDYYGGLNDIKQKQIRVLYNTSYIDDPTRIMRTIRFAVRFNFKIEKATEEHLKNAISQNFLNLLSPVRIYDEINFILSKPKTIPYLNCLEKYGLVQKIFGVSFGKYQKELIKKYEARQDIINLKKTFVVSSLIFTGNKAKALRFIKKIQPKKPCAHLILFYTGKFNALKNKLIKVKTPYTLYEIIKGIKTDEAEFLKIFLNAEEKKKLEKGYKLLEKARGVSGNFLIKNGVKEGPQIRKCLEKIRKIILNNGVELNKINENKQIQKIIKGKL